MQELLEKFGLDEFFAFVCPGAILISSLVLWKNVDFGTAFWDREILAVILFLILSYTLGLIISSFNQRAQVLYLRPAANKRPRFLRKLAIILYPIPRPRFTPSIVRANVSISVHLEQLSHQPGLSGLVDPWDWLVVYRTLMADRLGEKGKSVLREAELVHRRFLFSMGVSLALFLLSFQALLHLILLGLGVLYGSIHTYLGNALPTISPLGSIHTYLGNALPTISPLLLGSIIFLGLWASFELRQLAIRMWEVERYLTASLAQEGT